MRVSYRKLFEKIKKGGMTQKEFREKSSVSSASLTNMLHNQSVTIDTICRICDYFSCMPQDIMEFIPDTVPEADTTSGAPNIAGSEQIPSEPSHPSPLELRVNELMQQTVKVQTELIEIQKQLLKQ